MTSAVATTPPTIAGLDALLAHHARTRPDDAAVLVAGATTATPTETMTFGEIHRVARAVAADLAESFPTGSRLMLAYPHGLAFPPIFLGCMLAGMIAVPVPVPTKGRHHSHRMSKIAADSNASALLTDSALVSTVQSWAHEESLDRLEVRAIGIGDASAPSEHRSGTVPLAPGDHLDDPDRVVLLQYTSGSTSTPKGVVVTSGNLAANIDLQNKGLGTDVAHMRRGGWIPHHHDMGLIGLLLPGIVNGTGYVALDAATFLKRPVRWLQVIDDLRIQLTAAPDFAYRLCVDRIDAEHAAALDLRHWKVAVNGSEPVRSTTMDDFAAMFAPAGFSASSFAPSYGLAESTLLVSGGSERTPCRIVVDAEARAAGRLVTSTDGPTIAGSGRPLRENDVRVVDTSTLQVCGEGQIGEIWLRGPSVAAGYWGRPATSDDFAARTVDGVGPFLRTGDLGALVDGELFVVGRSKETIVARGRVLHPHDIEHELRRAHPELAGGVGAVFALPSLNSAGFGRGDDEECVVVTHELRVELDAEASEDLLGAIRSTVTREFGIHAAGVLLVQPGAVLRTTSGKIRRADMRAQLVAGRLIPLAARLDPTVSARVGGITSQEMSR